MKSREGAEEKWKKVKSEKRKKVKKEFRRGESNPDPVDENHLS